MLGLDGLGFGVVRKPLGGRLCSRPTLSLRLAHLVEKRGFLVMVKFVSACVERDKKKFEKMDFCAQLPALLIEN